jgi:hypothetical protein
VPSPLHPGVASPRFPGQPVDGVRVREHGDSRARRDCEPELPCGREPLRSDRSSRPACGERTLGSGWLRAADERRRAGVGPAERLALRRGQSGTLPAWE